MPSTQPRAAHEESMRRASSRLILLRHGQSEWNADNLFTGWADPPLTTLGKNEAAAGATYMWKEELEFDVAYTSELTRAQQTLDIVLKLIDQEDITVHKSWRLNERMYGALTGLSKKMIAQLHGEDQFREWRRSYRVRPPRASSFSPMYPGNDDRYQRYVNDVRYSFGESIIRTISARQLVMARKVPHTESLKDCMERTVPYYDLIERESLDRGKNVLIASSENAIRGLLMNLCDIPADEVHGLEIPTGVPLLYDFEHGCLRLLDDQLQPPPRDRYEFGAAADLLFTPRDLRAAGGDVSSLSLSVGGRCSCARLATTHHSFLGSFSAVSKRNFATKYAFFQVFRDLQNYLADFLKKLQIFAKNRKILQNFCEISGFLQKKC